MNKNIGVYYMSDFWTNNPMVLFQYYYSIIPTQHMTRVEQMNAVTRFAIYFIILVLIFGHNYNYIIIGLIIIAIIAIFYYINEYKQLNYSTNVEKNNTQKQIDINTVFDNPIFEENKENSDKVIESGYIDSDGNYIIGKESSPFTENTKKSEIKKKYKKPTAENPYQNIVFSDYLNNENIPQPCNVDSPQIQTEAQNLYNSSFFRNTSDVYERMNSQRLFLTLPVTTIPNEQTEFANWLYKTGPTCKENSENCTYYQTPQYESQRY